jgi:hypothetical protein
MREEQVGEVMCTEDSGQDGIPYVENTSEWFQCNA